MKAGKGVEELKKVIGSRFDSVVVKETERKMQPVVYHVKDLDMEATVVGSRKG